MSPSCTGAWCRPRLTAAASRPTDAIRCGIMSVAGAKFTTARAVAQRITDALLTKLQHEPVPCRTASTPLPGGSVRDVGLAIADARREFDAGLPADTIPHLVAAY